MCGRATLVKSIKAIEKRLHAKFIEVEKELQDRLPNFNIAPTHWHPVVTNQDPEVIQFFRWGLVPFWAKDDKIGSRLINARSETILEKPAFKGIHKRRCLVPFDGFYEWKKTAKGKIPYRITLLDEGIFTIAGIWESWNAPDGEDIHTFTLLTQPPNALLAPIHDRMPVLLLPEQENLWLDMEISAKEVVKIIAPYPEELLKAYPVSRQVNNVRENSPELLKPVEYGE